MAYRPPQKRNTAFTQDFHANPTKPVNAVRPNEKQSKPILKPKKEEFPALVPAKPETVTKPETVPAKPVVKMDFSSLFKNVEKKKKRVKKLKWGTVLLTKKGMVDSMTAEEREEEEKWKVQQHQEERLWTMADRLIHQQNVRRAFDPHYESPDELTVSTSEEDPEEEEEVLTDEVDEDEFEPEI